MEFGFDIYLTLFCVALLAGMIDTVSGGGGLITIPTLLYVGLSPASVLATNKLQGTFGSFTASFYFIKQKMIKIKEIKLMIFLTFIGSSLGTYSILQIDASILKQVIPVLLVAIGFYFLFSPRIGLIEKEKKISIVFFSFTLAFLVGFYDGFFGPATGSFFAIGFVALLGYNLTKATAHAKILNFVSNVSSLIFFSIFGNIYFSIGLLMGIGQICGAFIGARLVLKSGQKIIRPFIIIISFIMAIKLYFY